MELPTLAVAREYVGGLSDVSKMPGRSISTSAFDCKTGSKLARIPGSVCFDCYARKGNYTRYPAVRKALDRRLAALDRPDWVPMMARAIGKDPFFRWHDSGDLQGVKHLDMIVEVARLTPGTKHWLPTREIGFVRRWEKLHGAFPGNLVVRVSAPMVDGAPLKGFRNTSTVHAEAAATGHTCPASLQGGKCGDCRACWDQDVRNVSYPKH
jgi:hypothetical protein